MMPKNQLQMWTRSMPRVITLLVLTLVLLPVVARAQETVTVQMQPVDGSAVSGTAVLTAAGDATEVELEVAGLPAGAAAQATIQAGTCTMPSASFATLPVLEADASGNATATGRVLFRGTEDVALSTMADGEHIVAIQSEGAVVACGVIPMLTSGSSAPATLPTTGGATLWLTALAAGTLGLSALYAGLLLRRRRQQPGLN